MERRTVIKLRDRPTLIKETSEWFASKWHLPVAVYEESIQASTRKNTSVPQWYVVLNEWGEIIAGAGVVDNDFHDRVDLTPNVCALFVEKDYRNQRIAKMILETIKQDFAEMGVKVLYLVTDHTDFYEKYNWQFIGMAQDNEGIPVRVYQMTL
ncbi:GNAT family N-acetyltransferase [Enterococcus faecium]|nr:GNAT family N-acetyltransferase [Enterococcus faecium]EME5421442.1 GNAT family N-acetyltransferase [Enterococcus faecium]